MATEQAQTATGNAIAGMIAGLFKKLSDKGKLVWKPTDNQAIVEHLVTSPGFTFTDWTGNAPEGWNGKAFVNTKGKKGENIVSVCRAIAFPDIDTVLADNGMRNVLYDRYISMLTRAAGDPEAEEAAFATIGGPWAEEDKGAYTFQAAAWVALLVLRSDDPKGMEKVMNTRTLRLALESKEYATSHFPGMAGTKWDTLLNAMKLKAQGAGYSVALFDHWIATRDVVADAKKIGVNLDDTTEALLASLGPTKQAA